MISNANHHRPIAWSLFGWLLLFGWYPAAALDPDRLPTQYVHDRYDHDAGLPAGAVWAVMQSQDGYLWLGTQNGLVRFDGVHAEIHTAGSTPGLVNHDVRALLQTGDGDIWIGTYGGGAVRYRDGDFEALTTDDGLAHGIVYDVFEDADGAVWFGTGGGVSRLDPGGELTTLTSEDGLVHDRIFKVYQDGRGDMWFASLVAGMSRLREGEFTSFGQGDGMVSDQVHDLHEDAQGRLWVGTYNGGFYRMTDAGPDPFVLPDGIAGDGIQSILDDSDGNLWLGTYNNGLIRINDSGIDHFSEGALEGAFIFDIVEDREGSLWLATRGGLHRLGNGKFLTFGSSEGFADATFVVAVDDAQEAVWAGTEGSGLLRMTADGIERTTAADGLASDSISALALDPDGGIWIGSFGGGLNHMGPDGIRTWSREDGLPSNHIFALHAADDGTLWVAADGGLSRLDENGFTTWNEADGLPDPLVRQIHADGEGNLWLGTNGGGLSRFDGERFHNYSRADGLPGNIIYAFHEDADGHLWIGSRDSGLSLYRDGRFHTFGVEDGLPQASIYGIVEDDQGYLWMSGGAGLARVRRADLVAMADGRDVNVEARLFDEADGLRNSQFAGGFQPAAQRDAAGRLWFPGIAGLVRVDPATLALNPIEPPVHIESVIADGEPVALGAGAILPPDAGNLEIHYTALSLVRPQQVAFRYRLAGYDRAWQEVGTRRTAYYTRVPPGEYRFQVMAANNDGVWSRDGAELAIVQKAQFWQTPWFRMLIVLLVVLAAWGMFRFSVRQFRLREQRLSRLVSERTEQLEQALEQVEKTSRIDGLTGVANRGYFEDRLAREWAMATRESRDLALVMVDIDHFKLLNDSQGHQAGDDCLRKVAGALVDSVQRPGDLVARYGGEEFIVLLPGTDAAAVEAMAETMRRNVESLGWSHPDGGINDIVTISAGCAAVRPSPGDAPRSLIERADRALYRAKRAGRNRVVAG